MASAPFMDPAMWDLEKLAASWRKAVPFPHVVIEPVLRPETFGRLRSAFLAESFSPAQSDIYSFRQSSVPVSQSLLRTFRRHLSTSAVLGALGHITGKSLSRVDMRGYVYGPGDYLLPHSDAPAALARQVAYAYYVGEVGLRGGGLEFFDCELARRGAPVVRQSSRLVAPHPNRMVLFGVSPLTIHQVREVLSGFRLSLTGWFYSQSVGDPRVRLTR